MTGGAEVFISYASADRPKVLTIADRLAAAGVSVWFDRHKIEGADPWAEEIVLGIEACKVVILACSDASMRSWAVKQEIQLAGEDQKALLPILLEPSRFPAQLRFFLAGKQWVEVNGRPEAEWFPQILRALDRAGVHCDPAALEAATSPAVEVEAVPIVWNLAGLRALATFTDQIWPVAADRAVRGAARSFPTRGLGAPQDDVSHTHRIGDRVCLAIELESESHLLLLDEGPEETVYCLCPSQFAPKTRLPKGRTYLPQEGSRYGSFVVTGKPGRENLLAILTVEPLELGWMPADPKLPARILEASDIATLLDELRRREANRWTALSTGFDVTG